MKYLILFSLIIVILNVEPFRLQGVAVKGRLSCSGKPWRNAKVKLYDIDTNADDLLDEKYSDKDGEFQVDGTTRELTDIDPVLYIYHDCEDGIKPCQKMLTFTIPKSFIHHGKASKWYDIGDVKLEQIYPGRMDRSCYH